ncbi:porin [Caballeronia novacaledonica]|uniref:porin n=1 Tax=Caballeronia novacaledonica TaxID=1544861 RepID=UPI0038577A4B
MPFSPSPFLSGYFGAHPGDIDDLDVDYRTNSSITYISPVIRGLAFGGSYALAGVPGSFYRGSTWSVAVQYKAGPFGIASGLQRLNNSTLGGGAFGADSTTIIGTQCGMLLSLTRTAKRSESAVTRGKAHESGHCRTRQRNS